MHRSLFVKCILVFQTVSFGLQLYWNRLQLQSHPIISYSENHKAGKHSNPVPRYPYLKDSFQYLLPTFRTFGRQLRSRLIAHGESILNTIFSLKRIDTSFELLLWRPDSYYQLFPQRFAVRHSEAHYTMKRENPQFPFAFLFMSVSLRHANHVE